MGSSSSKDKEESLKIRERKSRKRQERKQKNKVHIEDVSETSSRPSSDSDNYETVEPLFKSFSDSDLSPYVSGRNITIPPSTTTSRLQDSTKAFGDVNEDTIHSDNLKAIHNLLQHQAKRITVCSSNILYYKKLFRF